jgi:3-hydroxyacyl-[acyl-carrier-protein] dehydratase
MRWFWIDRFETFECGRRAEAVKAIALGEEQLDDYMPGFPVMPHSLIIEGLAQTGGILVSEFHQFRRPTVLAKVAKAVFHGLAQPGDVLRYAVEVQSLQTDGGMIQGTAHIGDRLQAEVELFFACLDPEQVGGNVFEWDELYRILSVLRLFEVGRQADGTPLGVPAYMREALAAAKIGGEF